MYFCKKEIVSFSLSSRSKIALHTILFGLFFLLFLYQVRRMPIRLEFYANWIWLAPVIILMPVNWFMEFKKWQLQLNFLKLPSTHLVESFTAGMVSDFVIPGIPTNFVGRIMYFDPAVRVSFIAWNQITNGIQFIITILCGMLAIVVLGQGSLFIISTVIGVLILACMIWLLPRFRSYLRNKIPALFYTEIKSSAAFQYLLKIGFLSTVRMIVFTTQFVFILQVFGVVFSLELLLWIWLSYLSVTLSPSLFLGKLFIRESITVAVFQLGNYAAHPILLASFFVWIINGLFPTIIAWLINIFKK